MSFAENSAHFLPVATHARCQLVGKEAESPTVAFQEIHLKTGIMNYVKTCGEDVPCRISLEMVNAKSTSVLDRGSFTSRDTPKQDSLSELTQDCRFKRFIHLEFNKL